MAARTLPRPSAARASGREAGGAASVFLAARVLVHDPLYSEAELTVLGLEPLTLGSPVDAVVVQADHPEYRAMGPADLGHPTYVVDGRRVLDQGRFAEGSLLVIGTG